MGGGLCGGKEAGVNGGKVLLLGRSIVVTGANARTLVGA